MHGREAAEGAPIVGHLDRVAGRDPALRRVVDPFGATEVNLVRALKQEFDPRGTLNRGRWLDEVA